MGSGGDRNRQWGWKIENWLRETSVSDRVRRLNEAIQQEGRCLVLAGARPRKFQPQTIGSVNGIADCGASLVAQGTGHIAIVNRLKNLSLVATVGEGVLNAEIETLEASGSGAESRTVNFQLGGPVGTPAGPGGFIRLHLFELSPGKDPDTVQGLNDVNVQNRGDRNLLGTANERARKRRLTHHPNGTPRSDNRCCIDNHPPKNAPPTEGPCN